MRTAWKMLIPVVALLLPALASAHGANAVHLKGTIKSVSPDAMVVTTAEAKDVEVKFGPKTRYERASQPIARNDLTLGEKVVVHGGKAKDGGVQAELVKVGAARPSGAPRLSPAHRSTARP